MTTVIIDGTTKAVYTDSRQTCTSLSTNIQEYVYTKKAKILENGDVVTGVGRARLIDNFMEGRNTNYRSDESATLMYVTRHECSLQVDVYTQDFKKTFIRFAQLFSDRPWTSWKLATTFIKEGEHLTFGSGRDYAKAALLCGKTPEEAIKIAAMCDPYTDCKVQIYPTDFVTKEEKKDEKEI